MSGLNRFGSKSGKQSTLTAQFLGKAADPSSTAKETRCDGSLPFHLPRKGARSRTALTDIAPARDRKIERDAESLKAAVEAAKNKPSELTKGSTERRHVLKFLIDTEASLERFEIEAANKRAQIKKWDTAMKNGTREAFWRSSDNRREVLECKEMLLKRKAVFMAWRTQLANSVLEELAAQADMIEYKAHHAIKHTRPYCEATDALDELISDVKKIQSDCEKAVERAEAKKQAQAESDEATPAQAAKLMRAVKSYTAKKEIEITTQKDQVYEFVGQPKKSWQKVRDLGSGHEGFAPFDWFREKSPSPPPQPIELEEPEPSESAPPLSEGSPVRPRMEEEPGFGAAWGSTPVSRKRPGEDVQEEPPAPRQRLFSAPSARPNSEALATSLGLHRGPSGSADARLQQTTVPNEHESGERETPTSATTAPWLGQGGGEEGVLSNTCNAAGEVGTEEIEEDQELREKSLGQGESECSDPNAARVEQQSIGEDAEVGWQEEEREAEGEADDGLGVEGAAGADFLEVEAWGEESEWEEEGEIEQKGEPIGRQSYGQHIREIGEGLLVSKCPIAWGKVKGALLWALEKGKHKRASWWKGRRDATLRAVVAAVDGFGDVGRRSFELAEAWELLRAQGAVAERAFRPEDRTNCIRMFLGSGPFLAVVVAGDEDQSAKRTLLLPRSGKTSVLGELHSQVKASVEQGVARRLARIAGLPLRALQQLAHSSQATKVLSVALAQVVGKKALARHAEVDLKTVRAHAKQVEAAVPKLEVLLGKVVEDLEAEREKFFRGQAMRRSLRA